MLASMRRLISFPASKSSRVMATTSGNEIRSASGTSSPSAACSRSVSRPGIGSVRQRSYSASMVRW